MNTLKRPPNVLEVTYGDPTDTAHSPIKNVNQKFPKIILTGAIEDKIKLDYAQVAIRELILKSDTTMGIEFTFTNKAKYSSLVRLFELCEVEGVRSYLNYQDKFLIFNFWPKSDRHQIRYGCGTLSNCINLINFQTDKPYWTSMVPNQIMLSMFSLILFITLIGLAGWRILFNNR